MRRFFILAGALAVSTLLIMGPVLQLLESIAWHIDDPGPFSVEEAGAIALVLIALVYLASGVLVAHWSSARAAWIPFALVIAASLTLGFERLLMWGIIAALDSAVIAHPSVLMELVVSSVLASFYLTAVSLISNPPAVLRATHLTRASS